MSICEDAPASAVAGRATFLTRFRVNALGDGLAAWFAAWRNRRAVASMRDFDDAQLADIGLSRHDVEAALLNPRIDPTLHLIQARRNPLRGIRHS